jgi:hypothetical protein
MKAQDMMQALYQIATPINSVKTSDFLAGFDAACLKGAEKLVSEPDTDYSQAWNIGYVLGQMFGDEIDPGTHEYEVIEVKRGPSPSGYPTWTVLDFFKANEEADRICLGGDTHWIRKEIAEEAKAIYEAGVAVHGDTESRIRDKVKMYNRAHPLKAVSKRAMTMDSLGFAD